MKFTTKPTHPKVTVVDTLELIEAQEAIQQAWQDLDESVKQLDAVQSVMDNINTAVHAIEQFGSEAVPVLNIDKGLENLLDMPAKLITADKALEGLGEAAKAAWEKLKEWVKKIADAIARFFANWQRHYNLRVQANAIGKGIAVARKDSGANFDTEFQNAHCYVAEGGRKIDWSSVSFDFGKWHEKFDEVIKVCQSLPKTGDVAKLDECIKDLGNASTFIFSSSHVRPRVFEENDARLSFRDAGFSKPEDALKFYKDKLTLTSDIIANVQMCSKQGVQLMNTLDKTVEEKYAVELRRGVQSLNEAIMSMVKLVVCVSKTLNAVGDNLCRFAYSHMSDEHKKEFSFLSMRPGPEEN